MPISKKNKLLLATISSALLSINASAATNILKHIKPGYPELSPMLTQNVAGFGVNNELYLLHLKQTGELAPNNLYLNANITASANYGSNTATYYESEEVDNNIFSGHGFSEVLPTIIRLGATATSKYPITIFTEFSSNLNLAIKQGNPILPNRESNIVSSSAFNKLDLHQGYILLGDLNKSPLYALAGRKNVDFAIYDQLDWYWKPLTVFMAPGEQDQVAVGFEKNGIHAAVTFFNGCSIEQYDYVAGDDADCPLYKNISDWSATLSYHKQLNNLAVQLGASYLNGMTKVNNQMETRNIGFFSDQIPEHFTRNGKIVGDDEDTGYGRRNPETGLFGSLRYGPVTLKGLYQQLVYKNAYNYKPKSWEVTGKIDFNLLNRANWIALNYSQLKTADASSNNASDGGSKTYLENALMLGYHTAITNSVGATLQFGRLYSKNFINKNTSDHLNVWNLALTAMF